MTKTERAEDIHNRYTLTLSERNFTEPGTENYKALSEIAKLILLEYQYRGKLKDFIRHGFRRCDGKYRLVTLMRCEKY